jgi:hypothetical protein
MLDDPVQQDTNIPRLLIIRRADGLKAVFREKKFIRARE